MNIYTSTLDYISNLPVVKAWDGAITLLDHAAVLQPRDWQLPITACEAMGGLAEAALPASAAIACAQIGIILIDDLLDDDPRGAYHRLGAAQTANYAAAFLTMALQAILHGPARPSTKLAATQSLNQMLTTIAFGQYLDTQNPEDEAAYWRVVQTKSAPFFGTALELGALFGDGSAKIVNEIRKIGCLYGEMIQIHDDLHDCMTEPAGPDWIKGRSSLPIIFAQTVDHPEGIRFLELCKKISDLEVLHEAQSILIRCGSVSYCIDQLLHRYQTARNILTSMKLAQPNNVDRLLESLIAPVWKLLGTDEKQWLTLPTSAEYFEREV